MEKKHDVAGLIALEELEKSTKEFRLCLHQKRFFEAHEALERIWFPLRKRDDDEVRLLRAYINAAVSFELYKRGRYKASLRVWSNFLRRKDLLLKIDTNCKSQYEILETEIFKVREKLI